MKVDVVQEPQGRSSVTVEEEVEQETGIVVLKVVDHVAEDRLEDNKDDEGDQPADDARQEQQEDQPDREDAPGDRASVASSSSSVTDFITDQSDGMVAMFREMHQAVKEASEGVVESTRKVFHNDRATRESVDPPAMKAIPEEEEEQEPLQVEAETVTNGAPASPEQSEAMAQFLHSWMLLEKKKQQPNEEKDESNTVDQQDDLSMLAMFREIGLAANQEIQNGKKVCSETLVQQMQWANEKLAAQQVNTDKSQGNDEDDSNIREAIANNEDDLSILAMFREIADIASHELQQDGTIGSSTTSLMALMSHASRQARQFLVSYIAEPLFLTDKPANKENESAHFDSWW